MDEMDDVGAEVMREVRRIGTEARSALGSLEAQLAELRRADVECKKYVDIMVDYAGKNAGSAVRAELDRLTSDIAKIEVALHRTGAGPGEDGKMPADFNSRESKAFRQYLRVGENNIGADERKALLVGDDPRGGFLEPPQFQA